MPEAAQRIEPLQIFANAYLAALREGFMPARSLYQGCSRDRHGRQGFAGLTGLVSYLVKDVLGAAVLGVDSAQGKLNELAGSHVVAKYLDDRDHLAAGKKEKRKGDLEEMEPVSSVAPYFERMFLHGRLPDSPEKDVYALIGKDRHVYEYVGVLRTIRALQDRLGDRYRTVAFEGRHKNHAEENTRLTGLERGNHLRAEHRKRHASLMADFLKNEVNPKEEGVIKIIEQRVEESLRNDTELQRLEEEHKSIVAASQLRYDIKETRASAIRNGSLLLSGIEILLAPVNMVFNDCYRPDDPLLVQADLADRVTAIREMDTDIQRLLAPIKSMHGHEIIRTAVWESRIQTFHILEADQMGPVTDLMAETLLSAKPVAEVED